MTLAGLFVERVLMAPRAVLLELHALRIVLLALLGCIVATLALSACESNQSTHVHPPDKSQPRPSQPWRGGVRYHSI